MRSDKLLLQESRKKLSAFYGVDIKLPTVRYYYSRKEINKYWKRKTAPWLCGWTKHGQIHILHPSVFAKESSHSLSDYPKVLRHECSHLYYQKLTCSQYPRWLNEGLACALANQVKRRPTEREALTVMRYCIRHDRNIYHIGTFWVHLLLQKFGKKKFVALLKSFSGHKLDSATLRKLFFSEFGIHFTRQQLRVLYGDSMRGQR